MIRIKLTSLMVNDQEKALRFYTEVLGFVKKVDFPVGEARWITVVSPADPEGTELVLEPNGNPVGKAFQEGLYGQGIPATAFAVDDLDQEYGRLKALGVVFPQEPTTSDGFSMAVLDDTCGNLIQLFQV